MRISRALFIAILGALPALCAAKAPPAAAPPQDAARAAPTTLSGLVQPSLDTLQQTLGAVKLEKWKRGTVREESDASRQTEPMRISRALFIAILGALPALCAAQAPPAAAPPQDAASSAPTTLSGLVQPSLDTLQQTLGAVKLEKWKRGTVREESDASRQTEPMR